jgi:hypothetical protein
MLTRALARPLACIVVCLAVVTGCGDDDKQPTSSATASDSTSSAPSPTEESSAPTGGPSQTATSGPSGSLRSRLLTADELPGFNEEFRWAQGSTRPENPSTSFGTCQRFGILSIGAEQVLVRRYRPAAGPAGMDRAGELVAKFPDELTARRAFAVLKAWRGKCADRLARYMRSDVGALQDVSSGGGTAGWYLLTYGPVKGDPDSQFFDAQGMALVGSRIAMVSMVLAGQDYNYEPGQEPMVSALRRAAQKLG